MKHSTSEFSSPSRSADQSDFVDATFACVGVFSRLNYLVFLAMTNHVGLLYEFAQKNGWVVSFEEVDTHGPDHIKTFTIRAMVNNESYPDGVGRNKKEARQNAAKNALSILKQVEPANLETICCPSDDLPKLTQFNYISWVNEYAQKTRSVFKAIETKKMDPNNQYLWHACKYVCDEKEFPEAVSKVKKEAKEAAAKYVYEEFLEKMKIEDPDENSNVAQISNTSPLSFQQRLSSNTDSATVNNNFLGRLNQYCQQTHQSHDIKLVESRGPAHYPVFVYKVVINKNEYPEGEGRTAKEAKQKAAQLALSEIEGHAEWSSQSSFMSSSISENDSSPQNSVNESKDDVNQSQSTSDFIVFQDSSVSAGNISKPVPKPSPLDVKPKIKLAANFHNSPDRNREETPRRKDHNLTKASTKGTSASNTSAKSRFLEDFASISKIGTGGFGRVFKAKKKLDKKYYAVKIVVCTDKSLREVDTLAELIHPNIVRYYTAWTEETAYRCESSDSNSSTSGLASKFLYIQMELCEGKTLRLWIDERNLDSKQHPFRGQDALPIFKQVLEAVKYLHSKNLFHRDLKPENIMFGKDGAVKVGDFGLATAAKGDNDEGLLERTKSTGTRSYMSPEQRTQSSYDKKVDIFALGLIYFELLWIFTTQSEKFVLWDDIRSKKFPKAFSERFNFEQKLIDQMLCLEPMDRPDASEILTKLDLLPAAVQHRDKANRENHTY